MKTIGVIAEFNPFHNGHAYLIEEARRIVSEETGEDTYVVVSMSGNFVQRGSLAIIDKYTRAKSALCSADIASHAPHSEIAADNRKTSQLPYLPLEALPSYSHAFSPLLNTPPPADLLRLSLPAL